MIKPIKIAIDLDGVIIDKPPIIPKDLLEYLFKGPIKNKLNYRFPKTKLEQAIRKISHFYLLRPPLKENIDILKKISSNPRCELIAISSRYQFLENETKNWLKKRKVDKIFSKIFLNLENEQPHIFKTKLLNLLKPDLFIDDDISIIKYLTNNVNYTKIFLLGKRNQSGIRSISSLEEIVNILE